MSPLEQKPILHGRDHCPGGADPIPCMISGPSGDFEGVLLATGPYAYWRLGETGEPWADTSGVAPASDLSEQESGTALSANVTGALATGDDGALEFNYEGTDVAGGRYPRSPLGTKSFDFAGPDEFTVAVWAKVKASAATRRGLIIGTSTWSVAGSYQIGWGLQVMYPARTIRFTYGEPSGGAEVYAETAGGVVAGDWNLVVGSYDRTTLRLYVNAELVDSTPLALHNEATDDMIRLGLGFDGDDSSSDAIYFYGTADEAAVWDRTLSQAEIDALYTAGAAGAGAGEQVLLSDGMGGTYWGQVTTAAIEDGTIVDADVATGADIDPLKLEHPGGTSTFLRADGTWAAAGGGDPADDTLVWMPLADSDGILVLDADDAVIPTLIPI